MSEEPDPTQTIENLRDDELRCPRCGADDVDKTVTALQSGNSGGWTSFKCRKCGHGVEGLDGDLLAVDCPWTKRRTAPPTDLPTAAPVVAPVKAETQLPPGARIGSMDLVGLAARMVVKTESPLHGDIPKLHAALGILQNEFDQWTYSPEDAEFHRRRALVAFINEHVKDPGFLEAEERKLRLRP